MSHLLRGAIARNLNSLQPTPILEYVKYARDRFTAASC